MDSQDPESGLFCLDWYDWNWDSTQTDNCLHKTCRDCSVWIDTIETYFLEIFHRWLKSRRDWSVWIDTIETYSPLHFKGSAYSSGLICLDWYDWNFWRGNSDHFWGLVVIDLSRLIRLKLFLLIAENVTSTQSGLICLDWYDWNFGETVCCLPAVIFVGIDLFGLIRLKPRHRYV